VELREEKEIEEEDDEMEEVVKDEIKLSVQELEK